MVRDLVARFGSLSAAAEAARKVAGFAEQFAFLDSAARYGVADDAASERAWALVAAALPPDDGPPLPDGDTASSTRRADTETTGVVVPTALAQEAVQLHERDGLGRRKLDTEIPGLGEWGARVVLYWHGVGKPAGVWLDEQGLLRWGPAIDAVWDGREHEREQQSRAIAPTPPWLRFPRP